MTGYNHSDSEDPQTHKEYKEHDNNNENSQNENFENPWNFDLPKPAKKKEEIKVPKLPSIGHSVIRKSLGGAGDITFLTYSKEGEEEDQEGDNTDRFSTIFNANPSTNIIQEEPTIMKIENARTLPNLKNESKNDKVNIKEEKLNILRKLENEKMSLLSSYFDSFGIETGLVPSK